MILNKEEQLFLRHLSDLQKSSAYKQMEVFSYFLSVREIAILDENLAGLPSGRFLLFGGIAEAERKMVCFYPSFLGETELVFPIKALKIKVLGSKFHSILPKHSDFLGAILGLGIERKLIGDIFVDKDRGLAYVFCVSSIADFLCLELQTVHHFKVEVTQIPMEEVEQCRKIEEKFGILSSLRVDNLISEVFRISRSKVKELFLADKVVINGRLHSAPHKEVKEGDIISVRGYGKFIFYEVSGNTKKDKSKIHYGLYH